MGVGVGVAGEGEDGIERGDADGAVIAVVEAAVAVPGDHQLGPDVAQDLDDLAAELGAVLDVTIGDAQEDAAVNAEFGGGGFLLGLAQGAEVGWSQRGVFGALVAAGDEAEGDVPAVVGELGDGPAAGEFDVVGVRHDDEGAAGFGFSVGHCRSRSISAVTAAVQLAATSSDSMESGQHGSRLGLPSLPLSSRSYTSRILCATLFQA